MDYNVWALTSISTDMESFWLYDSETTETCEVFKDFDSAKKAFRKKVSDLTTAKNRNMPEHFCKSLPFYGMYNSDPDNMEKDVSSVFADILDKYFAGDDMAEYIKNIEDCEGEDDHFTYSLSLRDTPCMRITGNVSYLFDFDPYVYIDSFVMDNPDREYHCHLDDYLKLHDETGEWRDSHTRMYITLRKVCVQ